MRILNKVLVASVLLSSVLYLGACGSSSSTPAAVNVLTGSFTTTNVTGANAAHIHDGNLGTATPGTVVVGLTQSTPGTWSVPAGTVLTDAQIARLRAGGYYVNVHTPLNTAGEIRGQLVVSSTDPNVFTATLDLAQEVPAPTAPAGTAPAGSGSVTLTTASAAPY